MSKLKVIADGKTNVTEIPTLISGRVKNIMVKGDKFWLPGFSPFPTMFSIVLLRVNRGKDCAVKSRYDY